MPTAGSWHRATRSLAALTSALREKEATTKARQDYEYEALKRLYTECEPLLFQFFELAEDAESRVRASPETVAREICGPTAPAG